MRCERSDEVARLEWMNEAETRAFEAHAGGCDECRRAQARIARSRAVLQLGVRELSVEGRVAMRAGIDAKLERERPARSVWPFWMPVTIAGVALIVAIALSISTQTSQSLSVQPREVVIAELRSGSRLPVAGGAVVIEADAKIALVMDGAATEAKLEVGTIRLDVAEDRVFFVDTPMAEVRAAGNAVRVIADRAATAVEVERGIAEVRAKTAGAAVEKIGAGQSLRVPRAVAELEAPEAHDATEAKIVHRAKRRALNALRAKARKEARDEGADRELEVARSVEEPSNDEASHRAPAHESSAATPSIPAAEPKQEAAPAITPVVAPREPVPARPRTAQEMIAEADALRLAGDLEGAAAIYLAVSKMPGPLSEDAAYHYADTLARAGQSEKALSALSSMQGTRFASERTALRVRVLLSLGRVDEAVRAIEDSRSTTVELETARLAAARASIDDNPQASSRLIEPLLGPSNPKSIRIRALRIGVLAARAQGDKDLESELRRRLTELEKSE